MKALAEAMYDYAKNNKAKVGGRVGSEMVVGIGLSYVGGVPGGVVGTIANINAAYGDQRDVLNEKVEAGIEDAAEALMGGHTEWGHPLKGFVSRDNTPRSRKNWHFPLQRIVGGFLRAFLPVGPFRARFFHCFRVDDLFTAPVTHQDQGLRACNNQAGQTEPRRVLLFMPSPWPLCDPGKFLVPCRIQLHYSNIMVFPPLFWFTAWAVKHLL